MLELLFSQWNFLIGLLFTSTRVSPFESSLFLCVVFRDCWAVLIWVVPILGWFQIWVVPIEMILIFFLLLQFDDGFGHVVCRRQFKDSFLFGPVTPPILLVSHQHFESDWLIWLPKLLICSLDALLAWEDRVKFWRRCTIVNLFDSFDNSLDFFLRRKSLEIDGFLMATFVLHFQLVTTGAARIVFQGHT